MPEQMQQQSEKKQKKFFGYPEIHDESWGGVSGRGKFNIHLFDRGMIENKHVGHLIISMFLQFDYKGFDNITDQQKQDYAKMVKDNILHFWKKDSWKLVPNEKKSDILYDKIYDEIFVKFSIQTAVEGWNYDDDFEITIDNMDCKEGNCRAYVEHDIWGLPVGQNMYLYVGNKNHEIILDDFGGERCTVAHEFGHCLGLQDEYIESNQSLDRDATWWRILYSFIHGAPYKFDDKSMMVSNQQVRLRHYWPFAQWVSKKLNFQYAVTDGNRIFFVPENLWKPLKNEDGVKGPGGFGNYRLFLFSIGNDDFQEVLQQRYSSALGQKINVIFDSLLVVRLNLQLYFTDWKGSPNLKPKSNVSDEKKKAFYWSDDEKIDVMRKIIGDKYSNPPLVGIIDEYWNNRFYLTAEEGLYRKTAVLFDVRTLTDVESWQGRDDAESCNVSDDFEIEFRKGTVDAATDYKAIGKGNIVLPSKCINIDFDGSKFWHHIGHLIGLQDESSNIHCGDSKKEYINEKDSIMHTGSTVKWRHYWPFAEWLIKKTGVGYWVSDGSNKYNQRIDDNPA